MFPADGVPKEGRDGSMKKKRPDQLYCRSRPLRRVEQRSLSFYRARVDNWFSTTTRYPALLPPLMAATAILHRRSELRSPRLAAAMIR